jgi:RimJ/RimL family protein N-acetyltransferase
MSDSFNFRPANQLDADLIAAWFNAPHVMEFWGDPEVNTGDFGDVMAGRASLFNYWIGANGDTPFCLLITTNAATGTPEHLAPFLSDQGDVWTLDVLIGPADYLGRGVGTQAITSFLQFLRAVNPNLVAMLIDPEAENPRAIHVYGKVGFRQVSTFTPKDGDFQGKLHVLMAYHYDQPGP